MGTNSKIGTTYGYERLLKGVPESAILVEAAIRRGTSVSELIKPSSPSAARVSLAEWKNAVLSAQNVDFPNMNPLYRVYDNIRIDLLLSAALDKRIMRAQQAKFNLVNESGKPDEKAKLLLEKQWFLDFIRHAMESQFEHFRLIEHFKFDENGELIECKAINKYHVISKKGIVVKEEGDDKGTSYLEGPIAAFYLPVGDPDSLGLLYKVAPIILAIKYAIGHWCEFDEKLGIPFRAVTSNAADAKRQQQLAVIMENMGAAGWAVLNEGEKVDLLELSGTDPTKCFENLIQMLDARVQTYLLGQSSTTSSDKNKGTYGSLMVLQEVTEMVHQSDLTFLSYLINDRLFKNLALLSPAYKPLEKLKLDWDKSVDHTPSEIVDYVTKLEEYYEVDAEWITEKTGIPIVGRKKLATGAEPPKPEPPKDDKKKRALSNLDAFYEVGCCTGHDVEAAVPSFEEAVLRVAKLIFQKKQKGVLDKGLLNSTADYLVQGVLSGFKPVTDDSDEKDIQLVSQLKENVYVFSGFKTYEQLRTITDLLIDDKGAARTWPQFKKEVLQVNAKYNQAYLRAEYDNAVISASQASYWNDIQTNKKDLPWLKFVATNDERTTETCRALDGVTLPADHSFWKTYFLPLHWKERSLIQQLASGTATDMSKILLPELQDMFKQNVGITGVAFPDTHPYYEVSKAEKAKVLKEVKKYKPKDL